MKIRIVNTVIWPVTVNIQEDGGTTDKHNFFANFKRISEDRFNELSMSQNTTLLLKEVIIGAGETEQEAKAAITPEELNDLLKQSNYRSGLYQHYLQMDAGIAAKNSKTLPESG